MTLPIPHHTSESAVQIASLPDGDKLAYLDSGPVPNTNDFTTLILLHGMVFNAYSLEHLLPLAHKYNLRLVIPQRKDYLGSSEYTDAEIATLNENPHVFFQNVGLTLARFVSYLVQNTSICLPREDRSKGGIGIAGWSIGATHAMAMFAGCNMLEDPSYPTIMPYVTTLVLSDPPYCNFGLDPPIENVFANVPFSDQVKEAFGVALSCYYDQPAEWDGQLSTLDLRGCTDRCSLATWSLARQDRCTEDFPVRSEMPILANTSVQSYLGELTTDALFSIEPKSTPFPLARIAYIYAKQSSWHSVAARYEIGNRRRELLKQGRGTDLRPMFFKDVEWGNHFIHCDYPEEFMEILEQCVRQTH